MKERMRIPADLSWFQTHKEELEDLCHLLVDPQMLITDSLTSDGGREKGRRKRQQWWFKKYIFKYNYCKVHIIFNYYNRLIIRG